MSVTAHLADISSIGRDATSGGYSRLAWTDADLTLREWFTGQAAGLGLDVETDRNGNIWAWWGDATADDAIVTGSHVGERARGHQAGGEGRNDQRAKHGAHVSRSLMANSRHPLQLPRNRVYPAYHDRRFQPLSDH